MQRVLDFIKRLLGRGGSPLDDLEDFSWLVSPRDVHDVAAWDRYWKDQVTHGFSPFMYDIFCDDETLVKAIAGLGFKTVLCAGSGISGEPRALAEAGLDVTALDSSPIAMKIAQSYELTLEGFDHFLGQGYRKSRGRVTYIVGDLTDTTVCPGPFDVIIERRTVQLFPEDERQRAVDMLLSRLSGQGIFLSHCHDGAWKPPAPRVHFVEPLLVLRGLTRWNGVPPLKPDGRVAWLLMTTG